MKAIDSILDTSGDPELAHHQWKILSTLIPKNLFGTSGFLSFLSLLGNTHFLIEFLQKHPSVLPGLLKSRYLSKLKPKALMENEIGAQLQTPTPSPAVLKKILRLYKYREMTRIAIRDLAGLAPFEDIGLELSSLASATLETALRTLLPKKNHFVVLGMGKLGGEDLNFSSDIDLIYAYHQDPKAPLLHESLSRTAENLTHIIHEKTEDGFVFRVDLDLRPEGRSGPIIHTDEALMTYYEVKGAPWERSALLKARPVAGQEALGEKILHDLAPFIYRKSIDTTTVQEIKSMKKKIHDELVKSRSKGYNVKLGKGGIREIEFFVAAFQLIYGGKDPKLRERNTLKTLQYLSETGLLPSEDSLKLREAYVFLRKTEHRLQMLEERQTHTIPTDPPSLLALARRMGFKNREELEKTLQTMTTRVNDCFEGLAP